LQGELDRLIYEYFGLSAQEISLVEDTCEIADASDTPASIEAARNIPTLQAAGVPELATYAETLTTTLNTWATGPVHVASFGGVDANLGLALVELVQTKTPQQFKVRSVGNELALALKRLQDASTEKDGRLAYLRGAWIFEGKRTFFVKPALRGQWTR